MEEWYSSWPGMMVNAYEAALDGSPGLAGGRGGSIVLCGMGGSGHVAEVVAALDWRLRVVKGHRLPPGPRPSAVVGISYSGETVETIECVAAAARLGVPVAAVTAPGSSLWRLVTSHGGRAAPVPGGMLPRAALAPMAGALLALLYGQEARGLVRGVAAAVDWGWLSGVAAAAGSMLSRGTPVVGSCGLYAPASRRWASEFAENAKRLLLAEEYPEAAHNLVSSWADGRGDYRFLLIAANREDEDPLCARLEGIVWEEYRARGPAMMLDLRGYSRVSPLAVFLASAMAAGLASVRAALLAGLDPAATGGIDRIKAKVRSAAGWTPAWLGEASRA